MSKDTIYRQDAIDYLIVKANHEGAYGYINAKEIHDYLSELPSAEKEPDPEWRKKHYEISYNQGYVDACKYYENLPERKNGKWIDDKCSACGYKCSACGYRVEPWNNTPYCPNCGADMRGEQND